MKKFLTLIFMFALSNSCLAFEINGWHLINEYSRPLILTANSEDAGKIIYKTYEHDNSKKTFEIILTQGSGTGGLYVPDEIKNSKGLMPASEYKIIEVNGKKAILENQPYMPLALAVKVDEDIVMTFESSSLGQEELIETAEKILQSR